MSKKYTILSNYTAPERDISTHTLEEFIDLCEFNLGSLKDWFEDYRYDAEVEQGESYYNESRKKEIEYPDGSTHKIDIPVVLSYCNTHSFDEEVEYELKKLKNGEILIRGEMEWTGGSWNSYSIELDESEKFDTKKIQATGYLGMVVEYTYDGTSFENNEDWGLTDGYINLNVYLKLDNEVHELDLDAIDRSLEENDLNTFNPTAEEIEEIRAHLKKYFKDQKNEENKEEVLVKDGPHKTYFEREGLEGILYKEGFLKNGQWNGPYKAYHNNGELNLEGNYKDGFRVGRWKMYASTSDYLKKMGLKGYLYLDYYYKDEYDDKDIETLANDEYGKGLKHGPYIKYFYNGNIELEGVYKNDKEDGLFKKYFFEGQLKLEQTYTNGVLVE